MALPLLPDDYKNLCGKSPEFNHSEMDFNIEEFKDRLYDDVKLAIKEFGKSKIENANGKRIFDYVFDILTGDEEMPNINVDVEKTIDGIAKSAKEAVNVAIRNKLCQDIQVGKATVNIGKIMDSISNLSMKDQKTLLDGGQNSIKLINKLREEIYNDITSGKILGVGNTNQISNKISAMQNFK